MDEGTEIIPLVESDSYIVVDIIANYDWYLTDDTKMQISVGVKNLTDAYQSDLDRGVERDPAYIYGPSMPRTGYFGISYGL
jgi:outer membrane receptor for ferrienterochelin and colicins